jgi:general secretion pathway protein G
MPMRPKTSRHSGFSLIELMILLVIVAVLAMIAVPGYQQYVQRAKTAAAIADIGHIQMAINAYALANNGTLPASLGTINMATMLDPWGNPYYYLSFAGGNGGARKDKSLHPLNTDYDLYSAGPDGQTVLALTAKKSKDDIIRANDGSFIGVAADY